MKKIKKIIRTLFLVLLLIMAAVGMGLPFNNISSKENYMHRQITKEQTQKKDDEEESDHEIK